MMNSFKRGIGYQIAKIVVTVAVAFIIALLTGKVHALADIEFQEEITPWSSNPGVTARVDDPSSQSSLYRIMNAPFDTTYTNTNGYKYMVFYGTFLFNASGSTSYDYDLKLLLIQLQANNHAASNCSIESNTLIICPIDKDVEYISLRVYVSQSFNVSSSSNLYLKIQILKYVGLYNKGVSGGAQAINESINNDTVSTDTENSNTVDSWSSSTAENGTITQLITLPITLYTSILNNINGSCTTFNLGSLYGSNLTMSCIRIQDYVGSSLWSAIDILFSGFFILIISKKMIKVFNNISSMKEGDILD